MNYAQFIELTEYDTTTPIIYVNLKTIYFMRRFADSTIMALPDGGCIKVEETPDQIIALIKYAFDEQAK